MSKKIGFIGCGNMGSAMVGGLIKSGFKSAEDIIISTKSEESLKNLKDKFKNVTLTLDNKVVAEKADILVLAVKPNIYKIVIHEVKHLLRREQLIVTIAAGVTIENMDKWLGEGMKIVRTMPNTPALVGAAMSAVCPNSNVSDEELNYVIEMFSSFGECVELQEKDFHAFIALCGSSPAYIFMLIEAMADGAVKLGISRNKAYTMASQSVLGSAKMVLETNEHPGKLKDMVCSPGGTTIDAVVNLEKNGFRNSIIEAMDKCAEKSIKMS